MREAPELLRELIDDMDEFCLIAEGLEPCSLARRLLKDVRQRLRIAENDLDDVAHEPPPVPLWPARVATENT